MKTSSTCVLPGLDGTNLLLDRFVELAPESTSPQVIPLPDDPVDDYQSLCDKLLPQIQEMQPCHLIAESFSGPIAVMLAQTFPQYIDRLTLVATFVDSPIPFIGRFLPWALLVRMPMPLMIAQRYFVCGDREMAIMLKRAVGRTSPTTLAKRIRLLMTVNVCAELARIQCPIQYIRPIHDRLVPKRCVDKIVGVNGRVIVQEIDGPHLIMQTYPERVWSAIVNANPKCPDNNAMHTERK
jgi:pimeloyl-ACP methyl ester carboxylesterase